MITQVITFSQMVSRLPSFAMVPGFCAVFRNVIPKNCSPKAQPSFFSKARLHGGFFTEIQLDESIMRLVGGPIGKSEQRRPTQFHPPPSLRTSLLPRLRQDQ